jgi:small GTP-binding protein
MSEVGVSRKIIMVGDAGVGKTSLMFTYVEGAFRAQLPTIGAGQRSKSVDVSGTPVLLDIWDTAGQEKYRSQIRLYVTRAAVALIVFDVTDEASFDHVGEWVEILRQGMDPQTKLFLVGNKIDLEKSANSYQQQGDRLAETIQAEGYYQTSAATGDGVDVLFTAVAVAALSVKSGEEPVLELDTSEPAAKKKCC